MQREIETTYRQMFMGNPVPMMILDTLFIPDFEASEEMTELFPETWKDRFMEALANQM